MTSRTDILAAIRRHSLAPTELPPLAGEWTTYPDRAAQFAAALAGVGGECICAADRAEARGILSQRPQWTTARKIVSLVPEVATSTVDAGTVETPHALADVDLAIALGEFAVAENGAVWVPGGQFRHRVLPFLAQHLVLVVPRDQVVDNMHQAYERLRFDGPGFGVFISGPSKTADIEQSLVIGAHGPRSLIVFLA